MIHSDIFTTPPETQPVIYAYTLPQVPSHNGFIKIGYTTRDPKARIREQTITAGLKPKFLFAVPASRSDGTSFTDHDVHSVLRASGITSMEDGEEWFKCSKDDALGAIQAVRNREKFITAGKKSFTMRPEQERAVSLTAEYFLHNNKPSRFLWNAKMRFGKTFAAYQLCRRMNLTKILVVTFKPAAESAWKDDILAHEDFSGWQFISNRTAGTRIDDEFASADKSRPLVVFGSFQDLLGRNSTGGIKAKNEFIHATHWDIAIIDEYHFGAWRDNARALLKSDEERDADPEEISEDDSVLDEFLPITSDYRLYLSGTPFRALNSGDFLEDQVFSWTYSDEQREKARLSGTVNPYSSMPGMVMMTYQIPESLRKIAEDGEAGGFDLNEFFAADEKGFKHEQEVYQWLMMIRGARMPYDDGTMKLESVFRPPMPYADTRLLKTLRHTVWFLPDVASCQAMKAMIDRDDFFRGYTAVLCAGDSCGCGEDALEPVFAAMGDTPKESQTITLTCGKLLTGVTVRAWTGIFMLRNLKSPETYFQAAFRVQSAWTEIDDDGREAVVKDRCYVFDFALDRALSQIAEYSCRLTLGDPDPEKKAAEFMDFMPVLAFDGAKMREINAEQVLEMAAIGTSGVLLAKKWKSALLVNLDRDTLSKLQNDEEAMNAVKNITAFRAISKNVDTIINLTKDINSRKQGGNASDKGKITREEKERRKLLKEIRDKLMKFLTRIPMFMYLTDEREKTLQDVVKDISPRLFRQVTGITIPEFDRMCMMGLFNSERINEAIYAFKRYEDSSLGYTGLELNEVSSYGLFDETREREEIYQTEP